jgi:GDPmannose 4,6-dehydratase
LELGDLTVVKEWTFAGDVAEAIATLVAQDTVFEAVIGSGQGHSIEQWVEACFSAVGLDWRAYVNLIPGFVPEYRFLVSDPKRICSLGWRPRTGFSHLAKMMMQCKFD